MGMPIVTGSEILIIREPTGSPVMLVDVDRSDLVHMGDAASHLGGSERTTYDFVLGQRGQANIALVGLVGNAYLPETGWQVFLYEVTVSTQQCVFCGYINKIQTSWWGQQGDRLIVLSCISFEYTFDVIRIPGRLYVGQSAGFIFNDLLSLAAGWPGTTGSIEDGKTIDRFLIEGEPTMASIFDKLANVSAYIWGVDPTNLQVNFVPPGVIAAPFTVQQTTPVYEGIDSISDQHEFRDRQYVSIDFSLFAASAELFVGDGFTTEFTLRNPVHSVNGAYITRNTQNTATGTLSTQPTPGDTVSIGYPNSGSTFNWAPNSPYEVGYIIIDPSNHKQEVTAVSGISPSGSSFGQSGSYPGPTFQPAWNDIGGTTQDGGLTWTDRGLLGFGPNIAEQYTFVSVLDNTQFGQVLIGANAAATLQNLVDAINSTTAVRGITYSLPTWESSVCNADAPVSTTFTIRNKSAGRGNIASLTSTGTAFAWSATLTSGGITTFNTTSLSVGVNQPGARASGLSYNPGSAVIDLPSPLNAGTNLQVIYYRIDGNLIGVENTPLVAERALIEGSTGKYQALVADSNASTPSQALLDAQAALTSFEIIPSTFEFVTYQPGLRVGMNLAVGFLMPYGPNIEG